MKKYLVSLLLPCLFFSLLAAQDKDPFSFIFEANKSMPLVEGIASIISLEYSTFNLDDSRSPDSLLISEGDTLKLFLSSKMIESYPSFGETVREYYDEEDKLDFTEKIFQDSLGRALKRNTTYKDARKAMFMNSSLSYEYDSLNRLISAKEAGIEVMGIEYDDAGVLEKLQMNMGFGTMGFDRETTKSGYKFTLSSKIEAEGEGVMGMIGKKMNESKKSSYVLYKLEDEIHRYTMIEEDKESKEINNKTTYVRDGQGRLIEIQQTIGGESHQTFSYNEKGEILEMKDLISGEIRTNEVDERGNITKLFENYTTTAFEYDGKNNMIISRKYSGSGEDSLINLTVRKISYK
ncbi:MAG: hypothetical protein AAF696_28110 [Bacteroidota bacterium]